MTYAQKLRDPRWQKMRLEIFERDGWACQGCGDERTTLHVHHRYYDRKFSDPWDHPTDALVTLCEPCHALRSQPQVEAPIELPHGLIPFAVLVDQTYAAIVFDDDKGRHPLVEYMLMRELEKP